MSVPRSLLLLAMILLVTPVFARTYTVSAYCHRGKTVLGTLTRKGICAGPRQYLGRYVRIDSRRYRVEDVCGRGFDIWLPTRAACRQFGRKRVSVTIGASFLKHPLTRCTHARGR